MISAVEVLTAIPLAIVILIVFYLIYILHRPKRYVYLIFADWCGACQRFKPTWNALKASDPAIAEKMVEINADNKAGVEAFSATYNYEIYGYPTIVAVQGKTVEKYDGPRTLADLRKFILGTGDIPR